MRIILTCAIALAGNPVTARAQQPPLDGLDQYITQSMQAWQIPGLALAVVKDGEVVIAKGYGVREIGRPEPVTAHTLFAIGSITKSFTATLAGILAERGKLDLDAPATRYLPGFELADPYLTREVTVRDLMTHRTGVAGGDLPGPAAADRSRSCAGSATCLPPGVFDPGSTIRTSCSSPPGRRSPRALTRCAFRREILDPLG
jgi:CubicO group peptidase (beta-lactamase class C family)